MAPIYKFILYFLSIWPLLVAISCLTRAEDTVDEDYRSRGPRGPSSAKITIITSTYMTSCRAHDQHSLPSENSTKSKRYLYLERNTISDDSENEKKRSSNVRNCVVARCVASVKPIPVNVDMNYCNRCYYRISIMDGLWCWYHQSAITSIMWYYNIFVQIFI